MIIDRRKYCLFQVESFTYKGNTIYSVVPVEVLKETEVIEYYKIRLKERQKDVKEAFGIDLPDHCGNNTYDMEKELGIKGNYVGHCLVPSETLPTYNMKI